MDKKEITLLFGIDLSFNSTGITIAKLDNEFNNQLIKFYRVVFDDESNKTGKIYKPTDIPNVNQIIYRMPSNINVYDLIIDTSDKNNFEQIQATLRAMICSKNIIKILKKNLDEYKPTRIICTIENYIMPSFGGPNSLRNVSGLLLLQGFIREWFVKLSVGTEAKTFMYTPSPTQTKRFFTGNGKAEKRDMIDNFIQRYNGGKLLPNLKVGKIDDVIDSFALMCHGYYKYLEKFCPQYINENNNQPIIEEL